MISEITPKCQQRDLTIRTCEIEILAALIVKITVLLDLMLCRMVDKCRLFGSTLSVRPSG